MTIDVEALAAIIFGVAVAHTFSTKLFEHLANRHPRHAGLFHLLAEVEVVFGFWAAILVAALAIVQGPGDAIRYAESRRYTEPAFVFVIMVIAASRPILHAVRVALARAAAKAPVPSAVAEVWLCLAIVPLFGSLITEPAAMTLAALILAPLVFSQKLPEWLKYFALGVLFVNVSIGGTLTAFAAPPVLMVADAWSWDNAFMAATFGWKAAVAVLVNATLATFMVGRHLGAAAPAEPTQSTIPPLITIVHFAFLAGVVATAHHPVVFLGLLLLFLGFTESYSRYQDPLILREALLVAFFLAGLVVLGGLQRWWLQPLVSGLEPTALFFGALGLTAITDNAALTYLGSLIEGVSDDAKYMLVAGAVAGGGLTVIANAPNPAGVTLLKRAFNDESIGTVGLLLGALLPTAIAAAAFLFL